MKVLIILLTLAILSIPAARLLIPYISPSPDNLYKGTGLLSPCPSTPNCISSTDNRKGHSIDAIEGDAAAIFNELKKVIGENGAASIITAKDNYLHAEFRSYWLQYIDDLEILALPEESKVHIRSASRLGREDFGVNRKRIEALLETLKN